MNRSLLTTALAGALLACAVPAAYSRDNDRDWNDDDNWDRRGDRNRGRSYGGYGTYRDNGRYGYEYGNDDRYRGSEAPVIDRTMSDLQRAASRNRLAGHERDHVRDAMNDLQRLRSRFDDGRLRSAIENLSHLANANQIHPNDRRMLARDMYELRSLRGGGSRF